MLAGRRICQVNQWPLLTCQQLLTWHQHWSSRTWLALAMREHTDADHLRSAVLMMMIRSARYMVLFHSVCKSISRSFKQFLTTAGNNIRACFAVHLLVEHILSQTALNASCRRLNALDTAVQFAEKLGQVCHGICKPINSIGQLLL